MGKSSASALVTVVGAGSLAGAINAGLAAAGLIGPADPPRSDRQTGLTVIVTTEWREVEAVLADRRPVVMVSPGAGPAEVVRALEAGAADAVAGYVSVREVVARVRSIVHRLDPAGRPAPPPAVDAGPIRLVPLSRLAWIRDRPVRFTRIEFDLLAYLIVHPQMALDRRLLLEKVWGYTSGSGDTVTVHVRRLRSKIEVDPMHPELIKTVWGIGYLLDVPAPTISPQGERG
ncbi:MAG: response regulator transcription factor [Acidimicrobiia bacterium]|nr:response regulator transcription factor [Acidimicrobiia bacterium]